MTPDGCFTRAGHPTALSRERRLLGELPPEAERRIDEHLASCPACAAGWERAREEAGRLAVAPLWLARPSSRRWRFLGAAGALAAAAAVILLVRARDPGRPDLQAKGSPFEVDLFAHDGRGARPLGPGGEVHPGERLGFRVSARQDGWLLIAGVDEAAEPYLCYPQDRGGRAAFLAAQPAAVALDQAVRLDERLGRERIVALHCDAEFGFADVAPALTRARGVPADALPPILPGCRQRVIDLQKKESRP